MAAHTEQAEIRNEAGELNRARRWRLMPRSRPVRRVLVAVGGAAALVLIALQWGKPAFVAGRRLWEEVAIADDQASDDNDSEMLPNQFWTCGMHPWVILPEPGLCPICHMELTPLDPAKLAGEIAIDPVTVQNIGIRIAPVSEGELIKQIRTVGTVTYDEGSVRDVNTKISGWIEKLYIDQTGERVEEGEPLFELYSPELYTAQVEYLSALKAHTSLRSSLLESARAKLEFLDITPEQVRLLEERGQAKKTLTVVSPHSGTVIEKNAQDGMKIDPGMRLYRIADLSTIWVMATVYEYQLPYVRVGQPVVMTLPYLPGRQWEGTVAYIYPFLDQDSRQVKVRLEFPNPEGMLKPGMFASVQLQSTLASEAVLVPREAVISTGQRQIAFVSRGSGRFEPREVRTGAETEAGMIQVLEGLKKGELVVTSGQFLLDSESKMRSALAKMVSGQQPGNSPVEIPRPDPQQLAAPPQEATQAAINQLVSTYLHLQHLLATDLSAESASQLASVRKAAERLKDSEDPTIASSGELIAKSAAGSPQNLNEMREAFKVISGALLDLVERTPPTPEAVDALRWAWCPMAKAGWLQAAVELENPYMGQKMLTCGEIRRVIHSRAVRQA